MLSNSFSLTVNNVVSHFALEYVKWPPLQHALTDENYDFAQDFFSRAISDRIYIENIDIIAVPENPDNEVGYEIQTSVNEINAFVSLYDNLNMKFIDGILIKVQMDEKAILDDLGNTGKDFYFDKNGAYPISFDLRLSYSGKYISILDIFTAFIISLGITITLWYLYGVAFKFEMKTSGLERIMTLLERRDGYTINHSRNVAIITKIIAKNLGLSRRMITRIESAAKLHDIGKIAIPTEILEKNGKLESTEYEQIKNHPTNGITIIRQFKGLSELAPGILYHHERIDGSGYPEGLIGDQIPVMAQIIAAADVFESLCADRPYRKGLAFKSTIELMKGMPINQYYVDILESSEFTIYEMISNMKNRKKIKANQIPEKAFSFNIYSSIEDNKNKNPIGLDTSSSDL